MSFLVFISDNENIEKSRKALIVCSTLLLFFASLTLRSDELSFFGLRVAVSQDRLILIGRICVAVVWFRFLSLNLSELIAWWHSRLAKSDADWEKATIDSFPDDEPEYDQEDYYDPWRDELISGRTSREARRHKLRIFQECFNWVFAGIYNFCIPFLLGAFAVFKPEALEIILTYALPITAEIKP